MRRIKTHLPRTTGLLGPAIQRLDSYKPWNSTELHTLSIPTKKILVTGGAGFIGSHLVDALLARGYSVRVLDALVPQVHRNQKPAHLDTRAEFIGGNICDPLLLARALADVDVVCHQAAEVGVGQSMYEPVRYMRANTLGTTMLLEEISKKRVGVRKIIVASSMSIYGEGAYDCAQCGHVAPRLRDPQQLRAKQWEISCPQCRGKLRPLSTSEAKPLLPTSVYAISKQDQEQLCLVMGRAYGIPTVALRYFNVYGTRQALSNPYTGLCAIFSSRLLNGQRPLVFEDGEQSRDFVHVSDIVQANLLAIEKSGADYEALNIGTGIATTVNEMAKLLADGLRKSISAEITGRYREGDIRHCVADISKAKTLLGYQPKVALREGLRELLAWVSQQSAQDLVPQMEKELAARNLVY
jgi:dTDP-L-rhamnose 4-epimerase